MATHSDTVASLTTLTTAVDLVLAPTTVADSAIMGTPPLMGLMVDLVHSDTVELDMVTVTPTVMVVLTAVFLTVADAVILATVASLMEAMVTVATEEFHTAVVQVMAVSHTVADILMDTVDPATAASPTAAGLMLATVAGIATRMGLIEAMDIRNRTTAVFTTVATFITAVADMA